MVDGAEVLVVDLDAHLDAQVLLGVDVPGAGVADDVAVGRLLEERTLPEGRREGGEAQGGEEALAVAHHLQLVHLPGAQELGQVVAGIASRRGDERVDVAPLLRPDVAEQVGGNGSVGRHERGAVLLDELRADVGVQRPVERRDLRPQPFDLGGEGVGGHVVVRAPHRAEVLEAHLARSLVGELDEALVLRAHRR